MMEPKSYPPSRKRSPAATDNSKNVAIWIDGNKSRGYFNDPRGLDYIIRNKQSGISSKISEHKRTISRHHIKTVKGKEYWYLWQDDKHNSCGPVSRGDPRKPYEEKIKVLEKQHKQVSQDMKFCVIRTAGTHLIVDIPLFKKHVSKTLLKEMVRLSDILGKVNYPCTSPAGPGKTDNSVSSFTAVISKMGLRHMINVPADSVHSSDFSAGDDVKVIRQGPGRSRTGRITEVFNGKDT